MLQLKEITKKYTAGDTTVEALKGVDIAFRKSEFVSILGPSGCGKTTLLNIVGGLDRYTSGDLVINDVSTKHFTDKDWDSYRNHTIGFVFQNYNLIPHQSVLGNVELALTLSGVSKAERRKRAEEALTRVGLGDQIRKKPNQLSGGQMQRVAIARALVNNPDIILADEPTGALDTETSVQVMDILQEIAADRLVIMVTHNPELAQKYSTRIIRLLDGAVIDDSNPYEGEAGGAAAAPMNAEEARTAGKQKRAVSRKTSMSFFTALSLSLKNLATKKARTILTSFAGSIGIIGIALVLALANGFQTYIDKMQADTLSAYPLIISEKTVDFSALAAANKAPSLEAYPDGETIYINKIYDMMDNLRITNVLSDAYIEEAIKTIDPALYNEITYVKNVSLNVYKNMEVGGQTIHQKIDTKNTWSQLMENEAFLLTQYDILGVNGRLPQNKNEIVVVVDKYNQLTDITLMSLGLYNNQEALETLTFDDIIGLEYKLILNDALYTFRENRWETNFVTDEIYNGGETLTVVGILRPKPETSMGSISGSIAYSAELTDFVLENSMASAIARWQTENPTIDANTGIPFTNGAMQTVEEQYETKLKEFNAYDRTTSIQIYPVDFATKGEIKKHLDDYNAKRTEAKDKVYYTDVMELMVSSINTVVNAIKYVLVAFTAISLVVSSIMIGIITYISVLERTKEIGVLRSIGASKRDIGRVFNAETLIIGFTAGLIGVLVTAVLCVPINLIITRLVEINRIAALHPLHALVLVLISMALTWIAGLIPSRIAAKKDPVTALRSE